MLGLLNSLTMMKMDPMTVTCDYELAEINAIRDQFPKAVLPGCNFHKKQVWIMFLTYRLGFAG
jgi:hypothetical protein